MDGHAPSAPVTRACLALCVLALAGCDPLPGDDADSAPNASDAEAPLADMAPPPPDPGPAEDSGQPADTAAPPADSGSPFDSVEALPPCDLLDPTACDDDDPCTDDSCHLAAGCVHAPLDGGACDDGDACTKGDTCGGGLCVGLARVCSDDDPCTDDGCDATSGCVFAPGSGAPCDDGDACTEGDSCDGGGCVGGSPRTCDDEDPCTADSCDGALGCVSAPTSGAACDDGDACTSGDVCSDGSCAGAPIACDSDLPCAARGCDPQSGCVTSPTHGAPCDDGDACTTADACAGVGVCSGTALVCDDQDPCTDDSCDSASGCVHVPASGAACDDGSACTHGDTCAAGSCVGVTTPCDDSQGCTADDCNPASGCVHEPLDGEACDDGDACTTGDSCSAGTCAGGPPPNEACNHLDDDCDGDTDEGFDLGSWCVLSPPCGAAAEPLAAPCSTLGQTSCAANGEAICAAPDGQGCRLDLVWQLGDLNFGAAGAPELAGEGGYQEHTELIVEGKGSTTPTMPGYLFYATLGSVKPGARSTDATRRLTVHFTLAAPLADATLQISRYGSESDRVHLDGAELVVLAGTTEGDNQVHSLPLPPLAAGPHAITLEYLGGGADNGHYLDGLRIVLPRCGPPDAEVCGNGLDDDCNCTPDDDGTPCSDGDPCTQGDGCADGTCLGSEALDCDDGDPCTADGCAPGEGCTHSDDSAHCDDGDVCTDDSCQAGIGCVNLPNGLAATCEDDSPCTEATCDPVAGCVLGPANEGGPCLDGDLCTSDDTCVAGSCVGGEATACDDDNPCTADGCDPASGCTHPDLDGAPCDDGEVCTTGDACGAGACHGGPAPGCDDDNLCTDDGCVPGVGCEHVPNGLASTCDDGNPCTQASCDPQLGCVLLPANDGGSCDDGDACTQADSCAGGACGGATVDCSVSQPCFQGTCDSVTGCGQLPLTGSACDDGDACTADDSCYQGFCGGVAIACDDGDACSDDGCDPATGCTVSPATGPACDDGDACTSDDACAAGTCTGSSLNCDDGDACTSDGCDPGSGCTHELQTGLACDDGDACTGGDSCASGSCAGSPIDCDDDEVCTTDGCDATKGCSHDAAPHNGAPCDDGDDCTTSDACSGGSCVGGPPPDETCNGVDDDCDAAVDEGFSVGESCVIAGPCGAQPEDFAAPCSSLGQWACTADGGASCVPTGCVLQAIWTLGSLDGEVAPQEGAAEYTQGGTFTPVFDLTIDGLGTTTPSMPGYLFDGLLADANPSLPPFDSTARLRISFVLPDALSGATLQVGRYGSEVSDVLLDDALVAPLHGMGEGILGLHSLPLPDLEAGPHVVELVYGAGGAGNGHFLDLVRLVAPRCDGGPAEVCGNGLDDDCNCVVDDEGTACDDANACTHGDVCTAGACTGAPSLPCDDDNPCTDDFCDPADGCVYLPNSAPCDDGEVCTAGDTCGGGQCVPGGPSNCDDGSVCTNDFCSEGIGCVHPPSLEATTCVATGACGVPQCDPVDGCVQVPGNEGASCDDADACTSDDSCSGGTCSGAPVSCDDGDPCTSDSCEPEPGCVHGPLSGGPCDDGDLCTTADACATGVCAGAALPCDDANPCTTNDCDPASGCTFTPDDAAACDDGSDCTTGDACVAGACLGAPLPCDDENPCTFDGCDPLSGCTHDAAAANGLVCDDGDACSTGDRCAGGQCAATGTDSCSDGSACTIDTCDPKLGCTHEDVSGPELCDGVDNDCNGVTDDGLVALPTTCGVGACAAVGELGCADGGLTDSCEPGTAAATDPTCDGVDDDCDGVADEDYSGPPTTCGVGLCASVGQLVCAGGVIEDSCEPAVGADDNCDGVDDDCDGEVDEHHVAIDITCGTGACEALGEARCVDGQVRDYCEPGTPAGGVRHDFAIAYPGGADAAGDITYFQIGYTPGNERLRVRVDIAPTLGVTASGYTLPISAGPNPKGIAGQLPVFYVEWLDGAVNASAFVYNGSPAESGRLSFQDTNGDGVADGGDFITSSLAEEGFLLDSSVTSNGAVTSVVVELDVSAVNAHVPLLNPGQWEGAAFSNLVGVWFAPQALTQVAYDATGRMVAWSRSQISWYDTANRPTIPIDVPGDASCDDIDDDCDGATDEDFVGGPTSCGVFPCEANGVEVCSQGQVEPGCAAATIETRYAVSNALTTHGFYLPAFYGSGLTQLTIQAGSYLDIYSSGDAHLHGTAALSGGPGTAGQLFEFEMLLAYRGQGAAGVGSGGPKGGAGKPVDQWRYFDLVPGTGHLDAADGSEPTTLSQAPANSQWPFQLGPGAHDTPGTAFGASNWFDFEHAVGDAIYTELGDLNLLLTPTPAPQGCTCSDACAGPSEQ